MSTPPAATASLRSPEQAWQEGIAQLRQSKIGNPFTFSVATAGSERDCLTYDVAELCDGQRADLQTILSLYRRPNEPTRLYPIIGRPGTGKTHLLTIFQSELQRAAQEEGSESLVVVADHFSPSLVDAADFFLWQIVNHLLDRRGRGARMVSMLAEKVTARLLGEALRRLPPTEQVRLIPPRNWWEGLRLRWGNARLTAVRLAAVRDLSVCCDGPGPLDLSGTCRNAGLDPRRALDEVIAHLERTESKDAAGFLRRKLYTALAMRVLLSNNEAVEDFLTEGYREEGPQHVKEAGQLGRRLLTVLLEVLQELRVPVLLVFDQIEDFIVDRDEARQRERIMAFGRALAALVNNVPGLCLLVFAERGLWNDMLLNLDNYAKARIDQDFNLPGRPSRRAITMPDRIPHEYLERIIERRIRAALGDFDPTGLPSRFPFTPEQLTQLEENETTIRDCLWRLTDWFKEIVFRTSPAPTSTSPETTQPEITPPQPPPFAAQLRARWDAEVASAGNLLKEDTPRPSLIPDVQAALESWLKFLQEQRLGRTEGWAGVQLVQETALGLYGYLTVIRSEGMDQPGVGVAAWLAGSRGRMHDLKARLSFFDHKPCPVRTLVLFRADGQKALSGDTLKVYQEHALRLGRDVRIQSYEPRHLEALVAFPRWLQAVRPEVEAAGAAGVETQRAFVEKLSEELLCWIESWLQPVTGRAT